MSFRRAVARPVGAAPDLFDEVRAYQRSTSLGEQEKIALRFADAYLAHPAGFSGYEREQLLEYFTPEQIVELTFRLVFHSTSKGYAAALGIDGAFDPSRPTEFEVGKHGEKLVRNPDGTLTPLPTTAAAVVASRRGGTTPAT